MVLSFSSFHFCYDNAIFILFNVGATIELIHNNSKHPRRSFDSDHVVHVHTQDAPNHDV